MQAPFDPIYVLRHLRNPHNNSLPSPTLPRLNYAARNYCVPSNATHRIRCAVPLRVDVDLDVRCRGGVVPERQRPSLMEDSRDALRVLQRTGDIRRRGERACCRVVVVAKRGNVLLVTRTYLLLSMAVSCKNKSWYHTVQRLILCA